MVGSSTYRHDTFPPRTATGITNPVPNSPSLRPSGAQNRAGLEARSRHPRHADAAQPHRPTQWFGVGTDRSRSAVRHTPYPLEIQLNLRDYPIFTRQASIPFGNCIGIASMQALLARRGAPIGEQARRHSGGAPCQGPTALEPGIFAIVPACRKNDAGGPCPIGARISLLS
jgi:hypothetical protein